MANVAVDISTGGDNTVIVGAEGKSINVVGYVLLAASAVTVKFKASGGTEYSGDMPFGANGGAAPPAPAGDAWFSLPEGESLVIELGSGVQVAGHILYTLKGKNGY